MRWVLAHKSKMLKQHCLENSFFLNCHLSEEIVKLPEKKTWECFQFTLSTLSPTPPKKNQKNPTPQMRMPTYAVENITANK